MLIQFSAIWAAQNPSKIGVHAEVDCGALPAPHPMGSTERRGTIMIPSRVHLDFPEIFRLYSLGSSYTVWEW